MCEIFCLPLQSLIFEDSVTKVQSRGRILGRNPDKSLQIFPPSYSQSTLQLCLGISISSNSRKLLQFLYRKKEENLIEIHTHFPIFLRNPYRNLKSENSKDFAQTPQRNCTFMNSASVQPIVGLIRFLNLQNK
jgi:hypothetical protein